MWRSAIACSLLLASAGLVACGPDAPPPAKEAEANAEGTAEGAAEGTGAPDGATPATAGSDPAAPQEPPLPAAPEAADPASRLPPSLTPAALREELRRLSDPAEDRRTIQEERRELEAERLRLERLAAEIAEARTALRQETERLNALIREKESPSRATDETDRRDAGASTKEQRIETLARSIRGMKPKQAAALLTRLPRPLAATLLLRMRPAQAGEVLDELSPDVAAALIGAALSLPETEVDR